MENIRERVKMDGVIKFEVVVVVFRMKVFAGYDELEENIVL